MKKLKDFKKRYGISWINPHLKLEKVEYVLVQLPEVSSYDESIALLKRMNLRPATLDDMSEWYGWDQEKQVIICGSITEFEGGKYAACLCIESYCTTSGGLYGNAECFHIKRLAMINTAIQWNKAGYLLAIKEL